MPKINIIILNYNCWQDTIECLESVLKSDYKNYQIIVVDNDSADDSLKYIIDWAEGRQEIVYAENSNLKNLTQPPAIKPLKYLLYTKEETINIGTKEREVDIVNPLILIQSGENRGFAAGNNIALKYILATQNDGYIWLLNPDTIIEPHCINGFLDKINNYNKVILGSVIKYYKDPKKVLFYGGFKIHKLFHGIKRVVDCYNINQIDAISGASFFISIASVRQLGLLPEEYFMYWEETHYCTQAKRIGYKFDVVDQEGCCVYDKAGINANSEYLKQYLYILNGLKHYKFFLPKRLVLIYISCILKYILAFARGDVTKRKAIGNALRIYILGAK